MRTKGASDQAYGGIFRARGGGRPPPARGGDARRAVGAEHQHGAPCAPAQRGTEDCLRERPVLCEHGRRVREQREHAQGVARARPGGRQREHAQGAGACASSESTPRACALCSLTPASDEHGDREQCLERSDASTSRDGDSSVGEREVMRREAHMGGDRKEETPRSRGDHGALDRQNVKPAPRSAAPSASPCSPETRGNGIEPHGNGIGTLHRGCKTRKANLTGLHAAAQGCVKLTRGGARMPLT